MKLSIRSFLLVLVPALATFLVSWGVAAAVTELRFDDVRRQTAEFMRYNETIQLDAAQQKVFDEALDALPAPCCSDNTARTCCCTCNSARAWWGLAKHLIADQGYGVDQVRQKVAEWFQFINPGGFSGDACYNGGCSRPFNRNGCGGMSASSVAF